mmetsp:Transcript_26984/g.75921  ORF Transcript_26984/g.75921 Transcript_26984/m.75921 type:complete len:413 (-) Transcript_26984:601-1839(-)
MVSRLRRFIVHPMRFHLRRWECLHIRSMEFILNRRGLPVRRAAKATEIGTFKVRHRDQRPQRMMPCSDWDVLRRIPRQREHLLVAAVPLGAKVLQRPCVQREQMPWVVVCICVGICSRISVVGLKVGEGCTEVDRVPTLPQPLGNYDLAGNDLRMVPMADVDGHLQIIQRMMEPHDEGQALPFGHQFSHGRRPRLPGPSDEGLHAYDAAFQGSRFRIHPHLQHGIHGGGSGLKVAGRPVFRDLIDDDANIECVFRGGMIACHRCRCCGISCSCSSSRCDCILMQLDILFRLHRLEFIRNALPVVVDDVLLETLRGWIILATNTSGLVECKSVHALLMRQHLDGGLRKRLRCDGGQLHVHWIGRRDPPHLLVPTAIIEAATLTLARHDRHATQACKYRHNECDNDGAAAIVAA